MRMLLKGEVLGSRLTNNLIMELERTHNGGVEVGALQRYEPGAHGTGSFHGAGCHNIGVALWASRILSSMSYGLSKTSSPFGNVITGQACLSFS